MEASVTDIMARFTMYIIDPTILLIFSAGFVVFMYGLVELMWSLNSGKVEQKGKDHMIWGIVGMTIMVSAYGIINLLDSTFGLNFRSPNVNQAQNIVIPN